MMGTESRKLNRAAYIDAFMRNLDWKAVDKRFEPIKPFLK